MAGDANYGDVVLLLHCDGTNGSTTFTDTSPTPKTVTVAGNTQISTTQSQFGGASMYFDGTGDYLTVPAGDHFNFGTGDFTIELWLNNTQTTQYATLLSLNWAAGSSFQIMNGTTNQICAWANSINAGAPIMTLTNANLHDGAQHHLVWEKWGGVHSLYFDGVLGATITSAVAIGNSTGTLSIGRDETYGPRNYLGYLDEIRITKGVARYQGGFTPPTSAFLDYAAQVSGIVRDSTNALCARTVRAYNRSTGALVASTASNGTTGAYTLNCAAAGEVSVIFLDDLAGTTENDLVLRTTPA